MMFGRLMVYPYRPQPLKRPLKIRETPLSTLWYKRDDRFWVPKATFMIDIQKCGHACS